jgi:hypothetical protein
VTVWRDHLARLASSLSALYFGAPLYLVGGALKSEDPRDVDLVVVVPDKLFLASYGEFEAWSASEKIAQSALDAWELSYTGRSAADSPLWRRWCLDCAKHNARLTLALHRRVDFKTQPESYARTLDGQPRELLAQVTP